MQTLPPQGPHAGLVAELMQHPPFARMLPAQVERFAAAGEPLAYRAGEVIVAPADGVVGHVWWLRSGRVEGSHGGEAAPGFQIDSADLFPVGAALGARAVTSTYTADADCLCLRVPVAVLRALAAESAALADHLEARIAALLEASRQAQQAAYWSQALAEQTMETALGRLAVRPPAAVAPQTPLGAALQQMHARGIGSILVTDEAGAALGILTRHDLLGRVTLAQLPLATPIGRVMSQPVHTLSVSHTAQDAVLLMSQRGVRHVPVTADGRVVGIVSERDLYALHKLSVKQVGAAARTAGDVATLTMVAADIRRLVRNLLAQGVAARPLTGLITHLNDLVAQRLVELTAARHRLDLRRACWLAFGSEGRGEQTVATDQDNGLLFASDAADAERPAWLAFAREVNAALDACGYPLCKGNVMAGNPQCCLTAAEWTARFERWIAQGSPTHLLEASIYFDLRPIAGNPALALPLRERVVAAAAATPRFMKQMADNALRNAVPLNWRGAIVTHDEGEHRWLDLKLNASMPFVDAARLYALAHGVTATGTRERLEGAAAAMAVDARELRHWCEAFEFVQMLRLRVQIAPHEGAGKGGSAHPNRIDIASLSDIDCRVLKDALGAARSLQQRMALDYLR